MGNNLRQRRPTSSGASPFRIGLGDRADPDHQKLVRADQRAGELGLRDRQVVRHRVAGVQLTSAEAIRTSEEVYEALDALLSRGQQEGTLRPDLTAKQVKAMLIGVPTASDWLGGEAEDRRHLASMVCAGFRAIPD